MRSHTLSFTLWNTCTHVCIFTVIRVGGAGSPQKKFAPTLEGTSWAYTFFSLTRFPTRRYRTSFYVVFHFQMHNFRIRLIYSTRCSVFFMFTPHIHARIRIHYVTEKKYKGCSTYDFFVKIIRKKARKQNNSTRKKLAELGLGNLYQTMWSFARLVQLLLLYFHNKKLFHLI